MSEAVLFGSRATGGYGNGSDIDIAVKGDIGMDDILQLRVELNDIGLLYTFDIVSYNSLTNQKLREHIDKFGRILFSRS